MFSELPDRLPPIAPRDALTLFGGGLDLETPRWSALAGALREAQNYEIAVGGGYQDIVGYERFDGRPKPSDASFTILDVTITGTIAVGDTVTGATSGSTGYVVVIATYPDNPAQSYLVLTRVTGTWNNASENITVSAVTQGNTDAVGYADSAPTPALKAGYKNAAADVYRASIAVVPGQGDVWGGFSLGNTKYAIRDKVGGATAGLYAHHASTGWTEVTLGRQVAFTSGGTYVTKRGDLITGATSGATGTVMFVQITSGTFAGGDAAGWLTIFGQTGTFQAENLNVGANLNVATIAGNSAVITLSPGGRLDYVKSNFAAPTSSEWVFAADGVNNGWIFDGACLAKVRTGMTTDTPDHVAVFKNQLFFSFGGSAQHSSPGDPLDWDVVTGAGEIAPGGDITGFSVQSGSEGSAALMIAAREQIHMLYGTGEDDWNLVPYKQAIGAFEWTIQTVIHTLFLEDHGLTTLASSQAFGNFQHSAFTSKIKRLIDSKKTLVAGSAVVRKKNQYRLFFTDNTAIYATFDGAKLLGLMPILLDHEVTTIWSEEDTDGNEEIFFGSDNGYVYQMERGTSFDGDSIYAYLYTHFDHLKSTGHMKEFVGPVTIEGRGTGYATFALMYQLDYGRPEINQPDAQEGQFAAAEGATWDEGAWDTFVTWDDNSLVPTVGLELRGEGRNISWIIVKDADFYEPVLLSGIQFGYIVRSRQKG